MVNHFKITLAIGLQLAWQLGTIRYEQGKPDYFISLGEMVKLILAVITISFGDDDDNFIIRFKFLLLFLSQEPNWLYNRIAS